MTNTDSISSGLADSSGGTSRTLRLLGYALFWLLAASIPLLYVEHWGNSFGDPKFVGLAIVVILAGSYLLSHCVRRWNVPSYASLWCLGVAMLLSIQIYGALSTSNTGLAFQSLIPTACLLIIPLLLTVSSLQITSFCRLLLLPLSIVIVLALAMIVFRSTLVSDYSPFGSTIGLKNSLAVFLAQALPLVWLSAQLSRQDTSRFSTFYTYWSLLLAALSVWIILAHRTRSAWWMLLVYALLLGVSRWRVPDASRLLFRDAIATVALGLLFLFAIPDALVWNSDTPYWDSLTTMWSFEYSSGRNALWQVALEIINQNPWSGVGTGQYPVLWRNYISATAIDPKIFGFLRPDLPLFNDYLQRAVENGVPAAILLTVLVLFVPAFAALQQLRANTPQATIQNTIVLSLTMLCLATAADAFFDYPLGRAETTLLYAISLGCIFQQARKRLDENTSDEPPMSKQRTSRRVYPIRLLQLATAVLTGLLLAITIQMSIGLSARKHWQKTQDLDALELALAHWPWDAEWTRQHLSAFLRQGRTVSALRLANSRASAWPQDPESSLIFAKYYEHTRVYSSAVSSYRKGLTFVDGGKCYIPSFSNYQRMVNRQKYPPDLQLLSTEELHPCQ